MTKLGIKKFNTIDDVKKGGGSLSSIWSVPKDGAVVRFLQEPTEWIGCREYYDPDQRSYVPMADGDVVPEGGSVSFRYYANVIWQGEGSMQGKVVVFKFPKSVGTKLLNKYDKYGTITDRDYEIDKFGEGKTGTEYDVTPGDRKKISMAKLVLLDIEDELIKDRERALGLSTVDATTDEKPKKAQGGRKAAAAAAAEPDEDEEDDEDETPAKPARAAKKAAATPAKKGRASRKKSKPTLDDLGEAADEDEESDEAAQIGDIADALEIDSNEYSLWSEVAEAVAEALEANDINPDDYSTWEEVIDAIESAEADDDDDDDDDADDEDDEEDEDDEDDEEDEDDEDEDDEDDDDGIDVDFDSLNAKSLKELRALADEYGIDHGSFRTKAKVIQAILDDAEEDDDDE